MIDFLRNKKGIIFDMDGVLFNSAEGHWRAFEQTFKEFDLKPLAYDELAGMRTDEAFKKCLIHNKKEVSDDFLARLTSRKRNLAYEFLSQNPPVVPGCYDVVAGLKKSHKLAIATSASRPTVELFLESSRTRDFFDAVVSGEEVANAKPEPDIFFLALGRIGLPAELVAIVEDSQNGVTAACRAKIDVIGLGQDSKEVLQQAGACRTVGKLTELLV